MSATPATFDLTIHVSKLVHRVQFKKRAPRAIREIKALVGKMMKTKDVRIDPKLNKYLWSNGVRNLPTRVRVRVSRLVDDDEDQTPYTLVNYIPVASFAGLQTEKVE